MSENRTRSGRLNIGFDLLGILFGLLSYMSLALSTSVLLYPLLLCFLFVKAGWRPVVVSVIAYAIATAGIVGIPAMLLLSLLIVVPAIVTIAVSDQSAPYFTQFKSSVFTFGGCAAALLIVLGILTKGNLVDAFIAMLDQSVRTLPASVQDAILTTAYPDLADVNAKSIPILGNMVRAEYWTSFFRTMRETLLNHMVPTLLKSVLTSAFLCSYLTARSLRLQDRTHETAFVPLSQWHIPHHMTIGILLTTLAAYLYDTFAASGSVGVFLTMFTIMECVFGIQGLAAWDRLMCAAKATFRRKVIMGGLLILVAPTFVSAIGLCSALFGRHGLLLRMKNNPPQ